MSTHSQSSHEEDLTPLEYARVHGLSLDYLADSASFPHILKLQQEIHNCLTDDSHLHQFNFGTNFSTEERLEVSRDAASLLASLNQDETLEWIDSLVLPMLDVREIKKMRLELPLLSTDHESDCRAFARREGFEVKLEDVKLPMETVNDENNEGLMWPSRFLNLGAEIVEHLKHEKLEVSRDTLVYLQNILKNSWTEEDEKTVWDNKLKYKRVGDNYFYPCRHLTIGGSADTLIHIFRIPVWSLSRLPFYQCLPQQSHTISLSLLLRFNFPFFLTPHLLLRKT